MAADRPGEAHALGNAGNACWRLGRYPEALEHLSRSPAIHRVTGAPSWEAHTLNGLGNVLASLGRHEEALEHCDRALAVQRETGERADEAATLSDRGVIRRMLGKHDESIDDLVRALAISNRVIVIVVGMVGITRDGLFRLTSYLTDRLL